LRERKGESEPLLVYARRLNFSGIPDLMIFLKCAHAPHPFTQPDVLNDLRKKMADIQFVTRGVLNYLSAKRCIRVRLASF